MKRILTLLLVTSTLLLPRFAIAQLPPPALEGDDTPSTPDIAPAASPTPTPQATPQPETYNAKPKALTVGGVSIRGLSDVAAIRKLRRAHDKKLRERVTLWDGHEKHLARRAYLGASIPYYKLLAEARSYQETGADIPLRFEVDEKLARRAMKYFATKINHTAAEASLEVDENRKAILRGGKGAELAIEGSAQRVESALESEPPQNYVELIVEHQPGTSKLRPFKYLLSEYSTPYDARLRGRTNNLKMAARNVNGTIVESGKTFSTNKAIGPRTGAGWKEAKMFLNGEVVNGVGAGVCQCATTLYNSALLANLPIAERHSHTFRVKYAPASRDATIYWGSKDMRFKNNSGGPIYVQTFVRGSRFYARLFGTRELKDTVAIESRILSRKKGTRSEAYRIVQTQSGTTRVKLSRDYYRPQKS